MKNRWLQLTLESDVIFSASGATSGAHQTLTHIPGSNLRGAAASYLHSHKSPWDNDEKWQIFHSGKVRFLPGYPVSTETGSAAYPLPLSLRRTRKVIPQQFAGKIDSRFVENRASAKTETHAAQTAMGASYVIDSDKLHSPTTSLSLKSSTMARRADTSAALFTYESLAESQIFHSAIQADDSIDDAYLDTLVAELTKKTARLGRSKYKEFGAVKIDQTELDGTIVPVVSEPALDAIVIYAYSDLALRSPDTGQPTLNPQPHHFSLPAAAKYIPQRSWLDTRQYSPFNYYRKAVDPERHVITQGSVMVFQLPPNTNWDQIRKHTIGGVGDYRTDGLGQVVVQPEILIKRSPQIVRGACLQQVIKTQAILPTKDNELLRWLLENRSKRDEQISAAKLAEIWCKSLNNFTGPGTPTASQWSAVRMAALTVNSIEELNVYLFAEHPDRNSRKNGLLRRGVSRKLWDVSRYNNNRRERLTLCETLKDAIDRTTDGSRAQVALQLTAAKMSSLAARNQA